MSSFNTIVLEIAIVILIICLIFIGWAIYDSLYGKKVKFPPVVGTCPDYWNVSTDKHGKITCNNTLSVGAPTKPNNKCEKFVTTTYNTDCKKYTLANSCGFTWDGITDNSHLLKKCKK